MRQPAWLALRHHARLVLIDRHHAVARREAERITRRHFALGLGGQQHRPGGVRHFQLRDAHRGAGELLDVHAHVTARGVRELDGRTGEIERVRRDDARLERGGGAGVIRRRRNGGPIGEVRGNLDGILDRPLVLGDAVVAPLERAELGGLFEIHGDELRRAPVIQAFPRGLAVVVNRAHGLIAGGAVAGEDVRRNLHRLERAAEDARVRPGLGERGGDLAAAGGSDENLDGVRVLAHVAVGVGDLQVNVIARLERVARAELLPELQPGLLAGALALLAQLLLEAHFFLVLDFRGGNLELTVRREPDVRARLGDAGELLLEVIRVVVGDGVRAVDLKNVVARLRVAQLGRQLGAEEALARRTALQPHDFTVAAARCHDDGHVALAAAHAEVGVLNDDVQRHAGRMPLLRAAADEADAAEQHQLVTEAVLLSVEFGEAIENAVRHVARRREVHDVAEARLRVVHVAALLREHAEQELAATRRNLVLRLGHLLEDLRGIHIHLLLEVALADAELRVHGLGGRREAVEQRGAFRAREVVAQGLEVVVGERELRLGLLLDGHDGRVLVGDDPAAENLLSQIARSLVVALEQAVGSPADVVGGQLVLVLEEERLVRLERLPRRDRIAHAEAHGGLEQRRPFELLVNVGGGETMLVAQAEQRLARLRAELRVHAGEAVHRRTQDEAGQLRAVQQRDLLRPRNVIVPEIVRVVGVHPDGDAVDGVREVQVLPELRLTHEQRRHPVCLHRSERGDDVGEQRGVGGLRVLDLRAGHGLQEHFTPLPRDAASGPREVTRTRSSELDGLDGGVRILLFGEQQIAAQQLDAALLRTALRAREIGVERGHRPINGVRERSCDGVQHERFRGRGLRGLQGGEQRLLRFVRLAHRCLHRADAALQLRDARAARIERDHRLEFRFHAGGQTVLLGDLEGVSAHMGPTVIRPIAAAGLADHVVHERVHVLVLRRAELPRTERGVIERPGRPGILGEVKPGDREGLLVLATVIHRHNDLVTAFKPERAADFEELRHELLARRSGLRPLARHARDLETRE